MEAVLEKLQHYLLEDLFLYLEHLLCLQVIFFKLASFVSVLGIGGVISGGLTGIMILVMSMKAKKKSRLKPSYKMPLNWITVFVLSLIFIIGCIIEIFLKECLKVGLFLV